MLVELKINDSTKDGKVRICYKDGRWYHCDVDAINNVSYTGICRVEINSDTITEEIVGFYKRHNKIHHFDPLDPGY